MLQGIPKMQNFGIPLFFYDIIGTIEANVNKALIKIRKVKEGGEFVETRRHDQEDDTGRKSRYLKRQGGVADVEL